MSSLRVITNSELSTRKRCPREHYYSYQLGYRSIAEVEALRFGTFWHLGMEDYWGGHGLEEAIYAATSTCKDHYEAARLRALLTGYVARWGAEDMDDVVSVEREFRAPVVNPDTGAPSRTYVLGGKLDVLKRRKFLEHKTTSDDIGFGSIYWRVLTLNSQVSTYYAGAKSLGHEVDGCIYDVVRKPTLRPSQIPLLDADEIKIVLDANGERVRNKPSIKQRKNETDEEFSARLGVACSEAPWRQTGDTELGYVLQTRIETSEEYEARILDDIAADPDKYYQRGEVVRLEAEEEEAARDVWQTARAMREDELAGRHPRNADACRRYGNLCHFFDVCCGEASLEDTSRFVRLENVHAELSAEFGA